MIACCIVVAVVIGICVVGCTVCCYISDVYVGGVAVDTVDVLSEVLFV